MTLILFPLSSGRALNFLPMALRLEAKSSSDTNALFLIEPSLLLLLPAFILCAEVCSPSSIQPLPTRGLGAAGGVGSRSPCSTAVFLRSQETSQIHHVPVAVKSVLSHPQLPLLLAAAINLVEETSVMFESNFISSFINQVSAKCPSPGEQLCKRHGFFALLLNWGRRNNERGDGWVCSLENRTRKKQLTLTKCKRFFFSSV